MASSLPTWFFSFDMSTQCHKHKVILKCPQARSQSFRDEGNSDDVVESNLSILRKRIEKVRRKDTLNLNECCRLQRGWNYQHVYDDHHKHKRSDQILSESIELLGLVSGAVGFVFLIGSLCILLVSFLVHLNK